MFSPTLSDALQPAVFVDTLLVKRSWKKSLRVEFTGSLVGKTIWKFKRGVFRIETRELGWKTMLRGDVLDFQNWTKRPQIY